MSAKTGVDLPSINPTLPLPEFVDVEVKSKHGCPVCQEVLLQPLQTACGHRLCEQCVDTLLDKEKSPRCPVGEEDCVILSKMDQTIFPDFSGRKDLKKLKVYCRFRENGCKETMTWANWEKHISKCEFAVEYCPFHTYGCEETGRREHVKTHSKSCQYIPISCQYCNEKVSKNKMDEHHKEFCRQYTVECPHGCGQTGIKFKDLGAHDATCSSKQCPCTFSVYGCKFVGILAKLSEHEEKEMKSHISLLLGRIAQLDSDKMELEAMIEAIKNEQSVTKSKLCRIEGDFQGAKKRIEELEQKMQTTQKILGGNSEKLIKMDELVKSAAKKDEIGVHSRDLMSFKRDYEDLKLRLSNVEQQTQSLDTGLGSSVGLSSEVSQHDRLLSLFNVRLAEVDLRLQMLETASYDGTLMWKIRGYNRRKADARSGKTISLYSQPFYTSRHGYKMCARVYLNGDGIGKGSHLSLFFVVMKGDYDALLPWPFRQKVTLLLLDQVGNRHLQDTFRPDPASSSFQKPQNEMNVASGCPLFVSHSVLEADSTPYIRDETIFIKVNVDTQGLNNP